MYSLIRYFFKQSGLLLIVAFLSGFAIATVNDSLELRIKRNKTERINREIKKLFANAFKIEALPDKVEISVDKKKKHRLAVYKVISANGKCIGWAFNAQGKGFVDVIELVVATNYNFTCLAGFGVLASSETPNLGDKVKMPYFCNQFKGAPVMSLELLQVGNDKIIDNQIVAISGATISSQAVVDIINNYINKVRQELRNQNLIDCN